MTQLKIITTDSQIIIVDKLLFIEKHNYQDVKNKSLQTPYFIEFVYTGERKYSYFSSKEDLEKNWINIINLLKS